MTLKIKSVETKGHVCIFSDRNVLYLLEISSIPMIQSAGAYCSTVATVGPECPGPGIHRGGFMLISHSEASANN